jgi:hypothetical protein
MRGRLLGLENPFKIKLIKQRPEGIASGSHDQLSIPPGLFLLVSFAIVLAQVYFCGGSMADRDTWQDWLWWLFWGLVIASCVSYPLRWLFFPELWGKLTPLQEFMIFVFTVLGLTVFVVRPFCKKTS